MDTLCACLGNKGVNRVDDDESSCEYVSSELLYKKVAGMEGILRPGPALVAVPPA